MDIPLLVMLVIALIAVGACLFQLGRAFGPVRDRWADIDLVAWVVGDDGSKIMLDRITQLSISNGTLTVGFEGDVSVTDRYRLALIQSGKWRRSVRIEPMAWMAPGDKLRYTYVLHMNNPEYEVMEGTHVMYAAKPLGNN